MSVWPKKQEAVAAATRRFPDFELPIRRLVETSENFRDICEELADAEYALSTFESTPAALHGATRGEWQELVDRLVSELELTIRSEVASRRSTSR